MREIKFRGLDEKGEGVWRVGGLFQAKGNTYIVEEVSGTIFDVKVKPETVGQYIGMKDKNGKEIYEGDILRGYDDYYGSYNIVVVGYSGKRQGFCVSDIDNFVFEDGLGFYPWSMAEEWWYEEETEVVGNIHTDTDILSAVRDGGRDREDGEALSGGTLAAIKLLEEKGRGLKEWVKDLRRVNE